MAIYHLSNKFCLTQAPPTHAPLKSSPFSAVLSLSHAYLLTSTNFRSSFLVAVVWSCLGTVRGREGHACIFHRVGRSVGRAAGSKDLSPFPALSGLRMGSPCPLARSPYVPPSSPFLPSLANRVVPGEISCHFDLAVSKPPRQRCGTEGGKLKCLKANCEGRDGRL